MQLKFCGLSNVHLHCRISASGERYEDIEDSFDNFKLPDFSVSLNVNFKAVVELKDSYVSVSSVRSYYRDLITKQFHLLYYVLT